MGNPNYKFEQERARRRVRMGWVYKLADVGAGQVVTVHGTNAKYVKGANGALTRVRPAAESVSPKVLADGHTS